MCFPARFAKFLRAPFFAEHLRWKKKKKMADEEMRGIIAFTHLAKDHFAWAF